MSSCEAPCLAGPLQDVPNGAFRQPRRQRVHQHVGVETRDVVLWCPRHRSPSRRDRTVGRLALAACLRSLVCPGTRHPVDGLRPADADKRSAWVSQQQLSRESPQRGGCRFGQSRAPRSCPVQRARKSGASTNVELATTRYFARRSFDAHSAFDAFDLRSLAAGLNRCSAPCGVIPPTASPISRQLAPSRRAFSADTWHRRSATRRR